VIGAFLKPKVFSKCNANTSGLQWEVQQTYPDASSDWDPKALESPDRDGTGTCMCLFYANYVHFQGCESVRKVLREYKACTQATTLSILFYDSFVCQPSH